MEGTAALRRAAAQWSLAGDQQLLDLLQDIHQRIIAKCNETNRRLEDMSRGLRDASVNLQNVNNKFLALSNTQFVESRVYEDDTDVSAPAIVEKEPVKVKELATELSKLRHSLQVLEGYHEPLLIAEDSDSCSDDEDDRLVLKPRDLYSDRPLPYIIGSQAWRNKWHAGLVPDESDSDSSASKVEEADVYSDSEEEPPEARDYAPERKISTGASSLQSAAPAPAPAAPALAPAAVAAELARRLGGDVQVPEREPVYTQPEPARKLYKPQEPQATTLFRDSPPPLESSDEDIFAELHRTQPAPRGVDDLSHVNPKQGGLEDALFGPPKVQSNQTTDKPLYSEDSEPEIADTPKTAARQSDESVKKPVGGISLFGTNKHAESIGAAILNRHRRRSSTSGDESNTEEVQAAKEVKPAKEVKLAKEVKPAKEVKEVKKERDIFDDLFAKSEKLNKKNVKNEVIQPKDEVKPKEVKKDVFSDIFDDIDDLFSTGIVNTQIKEVKKTEKPLFNDDDDLFAEIANINKDNEKNKVTDSVKSDLFSNVAPKAENVKAKSDIFTDIAPEVDKNDVKKANKVIQGIKETKGLFDSDSDDGLFAEVTKDVKQNSIETVKPVEYKLKDDLFDDDEDDELFAKNNIATKTKLEVNKNISKLNEVGKTALFDADDELFKDTNDDNKVKPQPSTVVKNDKNTNENQLNIDKNKNETDISHDLNDVKNVNDPLVKTDGVSVNPAVKDTINDIYKNVSPPEFPLETSHDSFEDEEPYINKPTNILDNSNGNTSISTIMQGSEDKQTSDNSVGIFNDQTYYKDNILRTTRIASDEENIPTVSQTRDVVNDSDDDFFKSELTVPKKIENYKPEEEKHNTLLVSDSSELFTAPIDKKDIFTDIFDDVPPIFEKPKEPKKSKNVNALFDDDSDDEALFFKKNDIITDEKPDFSPSEEKFGIFYDEPPAIDVDFTQKANKNEEILQRQISDNSTLDDIDSLTPKPVKTEEITRDSDNNTETLISRDNQDTIDNTNKEPKKIGKLKPMNFNINVNTLLPGASPKKKQIENTDGQTASNEELHKTEKIEPKMIKSISFDDPELLDNKISKERAKIQVKRRPSTRRARKEAVRKSAIDFTDSSFDSSNDNSVKDEVKVEKIVKTVYILNDDDIFGSTNTNETEHTKKHLNIVDSDEELIKKPEQNTNKQHSVNSTYEYKTVESKSHFDSVDGDDLFKKLNNPISVTNDKINTNNNDAQNDAKTVDTYKNDFTSDKLKIKSDTGEEFKKNADKSIDSDDDEDLFRQTHKPTKTDTNTPNLDSDEELFRNPPKTKHDIPKSKETKINLNEDDDLFKASSKDIKPVLKSNYSSDEDLFKSKGIDTLGKVYNKQSAVKETHSIFDDLPKSAVEFDSDDIPQKKNNTTTPVVEKSSKESNKAIKKSILDDFSDEDDLFKSKTVLVNKKDKSLFGDDEDSEDLFGSKSTKEIKQDIPVALPSKELKAAEPVFVDPLSLFGDDE